LLTGKPQEVKEYCQKLIDVVGKGGGFIMSPRSAIDEAKTENVKAMFDFTKEYGVYQ
jgi:uroporphyrinogen-III decarboxylase